MKRRLPFVMLSVAVVLVDMVTKWLVATRIDLREGVPVVGDFLQLVHVRNSGAAFGIGADSQSRLIPLILNAGALAVFCIVLLYSLRAPLSDRLLQSGLHLILGGAVGNLVDRFRLGYVVDFVDVSVRGHHWPAFNVADSAICVGIALLFLDVRAKPQEPSLAADQTPL